MYTYESHGNGLIVEIFDNGNSIAFLQGDDAGSLLDELGNCTTDEQVQNILSQYSYD